MTSSRHLDTPGYLLNILQNWIHSPDISRFETTTVHFRSQTDCCFQMIWLQGIAAGDTPREQHLYPNSSHESFPTHQHIILLLVQHWRSVHQPTSHLKLLKARKIWVHSLERTFLNSELFLPKQKFPQQNWFFFLKIGIKKKRVGIFVIFPTPDWFLFQLYFFITCELWLVVNDISGHSISPSLLPLSSCSLKIITRCLLWRSQSVVMFCAIRTLDFRSHLNSVNTYFFGKWPGTCKNVLFWAGMKLFFDPLLKGQLEGWGEGCFLKSQSL